MELVDSNGISLESFVRGLIGIAFLILISYAFSTNKKAIKWKMSKILYRRLNKNFTENEISATN